MAQPYQDIQFQLQIIFGSSGEPLADSIFMAAGKRQKFGMIKVDPVAGVDADGLDIGPLKANPQHIYAARYGCERPIACICARVLSPADAQVLSWVQWPPFRA